MPEFSVYELRGDGKSYIGSVTAENRAKAEVKAQKEYGSPIELRVQ